LNSIHVIAYKEHRLLIENEIPSPFGLLHSALEGFRYGQMESYDTLLKEIQALNNRFSAIDSKVDAIDDKLTKDIAALRKVSQGYRKIRHRFIDTYKRNLRLGFHPQEDASTVPGADVVTDASLYTSGERMDPDIFAHLYGFDHEKVPELSELVILEPCARPPCSFWPDNSGGERAIILINHAATLKANGKLYPRIEEKFGEFVSAVEQSPHPAPEDEPLPESPVGIACRSFWDVVVDTELPGGYGVERGQ
jgi:hypothetical protein